MLHSDLQDITQFKKKATSTLQHKILGVNPIMKVIVTPALGDIFRLDLIHTSPTSWMLEKLSWKRAEDLKRLSDPLEKVKLLGKLEPTFEKESIPVPNPIGKKIFYTLQQITAKEKEYYIDTPLTSEESPLYQLFLNEDTGKELTLEWYITPQSWTLIPQMLQQIFELSGVHIND